MVKKVSLEEERVNPYVGVPIRFLHDTGTRTPEPTVPTPTLFAFMTRLRFLLPFCLLLLFYQVPNSFLHPQFIAEEGPIYFVDALELGRDSLFKPYAGCLMLFQRLVAFFVSFMPVQYAPHFYTYISLTATLAVLAYIARSRITTPFKPFLAIAVVACPHSDHILLNLVNIHWILALGLLAAIIAEDPPTVLRAILELVLLTVLFLTGPFVLLYLPLLCLRLLWRRSVYSLALLLAALLGIGGLVFCLANDPNGLGPALNRAPGKFDLLDPTWLSAYGNGFAGILLLGPKFYANHQNSSPVLYCAGLTAVSCLIYLVLGIHALWQRDLRRLLLLGAGFGLLLAPMYAFRGHPEWLVGQMGRYSYIPIVSVIWAVMLTLSYPGVATRRSAAFLLVVFALASASQFQEDPRQDFHWRDESRWIGGPVPHKIDVWPGHPWFVYYHPKIDTCLREPYSSVVAGSHDIAWVGDVAHGTGNDPYIVYALPRPTFVYGIELWCTLTNEQKSPAAFQAFSARSGFNQFSEEERTVHFTLSEPTLKGSRPVKLTIWVFDTIDQLRIDPDVKPCTFQLHSVELLTKPGSEPNRAPCSVDSKTVDQFQYAMMKTIPEKVISSVAVHPVFMGDRQVLLVHPEGEVQFQVPAGKHRVRGQFGILLEAHEKGQTEGARFTVEFLPDDGSPSLLFEQCLDPRNKPEDRGFKKLDLELPAGGKGHLIFRTSVRPGKSEYWGWSFWTGLEIE